MYKSKQLILKELINITYQLVVPLPKIIQTILSNDNFTSDINLINFKLQNIKEYCHTKTVQLCGTQKQ